MTSLSTPHNLPASGISSNSLRYEVRVLLTARSLLLREDRIPFDAAAARRGAVCSFAGTGTYRPATEHRLVGWGTKVPERTGRLVQVVSQVV